MKLKRKLQSGGNVKGVLGGDGNVINRQIPVKLKDGKIIYVQTLEDEYVNPDTIYNPGDSVTVSKSPLENKAKLIKGKSQGKIQIKKQSGGPNERVANGLPVKKTWKERLKDIDTEDIETVLDFPHKQAMKILGGNGDEQYSDLIEKRRQDPNHVFSNIPKGVTDVLGTAGNIVLNPAYELKKSISTPYAAYQAASKLRQLNTLSDGIEALNYTRKQNGGNAGQVLIEEGELYKDEFGTIQESLGYTHDDEFMQDEFGNVVPVGKGNGGQLVNAQNVVSDSYDKVKDGDRKSTAKEKVLKFKPKEATALLKDMGLTFFSTKKHLSPSELIKEAAKQRDKHINKKDTPDNIYSNNSRAANESQFLNEEEIYDLVFEAQEIKKAGSQIDFDGDKAQYGGVKKFYQDYLKSPNFEKRVLDTRIEDPDELAGQRLRSLNTLKITNKTLKGGNVSSSRYDANKNVANIDKRDATSLGIAEDELAAHELSHAVGSLKPMKKFNASLTLSPSEEEMFEGRKQFQLDDKRLNDLPVKDMMRYIYGTQPNEAKADMDQLRYQLKRDNIYDTGTQTFDKKHLQKARQKYKSHRFLKNYKDEDIIYLMNNIAAVNSEDDETIEDAQYGGGTLKAATVKGKREPLYVENPNDPRIKAYSDSLKLYNKSKEVYDLKNYNGGDATSIEDQTVWYSFKGSDPVEALKFAKDHGLQGDDRTQNYESDPKKFKGKIKPVRTKDWGEGMYLPIYKKPTQPVKYRPGKTKLPNVEEITDEQINLPYPEIEVPEYTPIIKPVVEGKNDHTYYQNPKESDYEYDQRLKKLGVRKQQHGGIPTSLDGLYEYPDQPVMVPSGDITMNGIDQEVDAFDGNTGEYLETMQPNMDYKFNTNKVLEIPKAQSGIDNESYRVAKESLMQLLQAEKDPAKRKLYQKQYDALGAKQGPLDVESYIPEPYVIKKGDSLSKIANAYGLTVDDLMKSNPGIGNKNMIRTGEKLTIPELTIKAKRPEQPVDRSAEITGIEELPAEVIQEVPEEVIPTLDIKAETVAPYVKPEGNSDDNVSLGFLDRTMGTNALREMMRANRSINLPYRQEVPNRTIGYQEEDASPYLDEIDSSVAQQLQYVNQNDARGQAVLASIMNNASRNKRQTLNKVNATNLQRRQQTDNANVQLQNQSDLMQEQSNKQYVDETYQTIANYDRGRVQQADYLDQMINENTRLNNGLLMQAIKYGNFKVDPKTGEIKRTKSEFKSPKKAQYGLKRKL